ncbi:hypothetical protein ACOSQ4_003950 [Xanthoceras sorbifolium]
MHSTPWYFLLITFNLAPLITTSYVSKFPFASRSTKLSLNVERLLHLLLGPRQLQRKLEGTMESRHCAALEPQIYLEEHRSVDREASVPETGQRNGGRCRSIGGKIYQLRFPQVDFLAVCSLASHLED